MSPPSHRLSGTWSGRDMLMIDNFEEMTMRELSAMGRRRQCTPAEVYHSFLEASESTSPTFSSST
jgi:hypothetical protein